MLYSRIVQHDHLSNHAGALTLSEALRVSVVHEIALAHHQTFKTACLNQRLIFVKQYLLPMYKKFASSEKNVLSDPRDIRALLFFSFGNNL